MDTDTQTGHSQGGHTTIDAGETAVTRSPYTEFARDIFLFSYFSAGINFKDIATLRYVDMEEVGFSIAVTRQAKP